MILYKMSIAAALVVLVSLLVYLAERRGMFDKLGKWGKQIVIGVIFGGMAVFGTEFGIDIGGAIANVRDAAPLCAGLLFGAPAGVIAGVIGGVERWFAVLWGAGEYTRVACSISTILAGVMGAVLRKYAFDDKKPSWLYGLVIGIVMEVIHMLMLFLTNMSEVQRAFTVVKICTVPMVLANGLAVMFSVLVVSMIGKGFTRTRSDLKELSHTFQRWLLMCVVIAFLATGAFTLVLQNTLSKNSTDSILRLYIQDVQSDISDASDANILRLTRSVANELEMFKYADINELAKRFDIAEIDVIDKNGIIINCTNPEFIGFDMASGEQSSEFLVLLNGEKEYVQKYQPISYDASISRKYAGVALSSGGFVQVGYDAAQFQDDIATQVIGATRNRHVGERGSIIISDIDWNIVSDRMEYEGENLYKTGIWIDRPTMPEWKVFKAVAYGELSFCMYGISEGYYIVAVLPETEALFSRDVSVYVTTFMEIIVFAMMFALIFYLVKRLVVDNIRKINVTLSQITGGNLDAVVDVRGNVEFASLSDDINSTVLTLKRYIAEAAARIDKELEFAKAIQHSALPSVFPPYPNRTEFDIYAAMFTAKEVGGDFYDFYLLGDEQLAFLVADVSGKGIPAALFMMTAKTLIKSLAEAGVDVGELFTRANEELCRNNDAGMFVTAWMGILNLKTGNVAFANAGHNPPLIRRKDGSFEYLKSRSGFVLAGMEGVRYRKGELALQPGEEIYLYTDGVTEATDENEALYGEERLLALLNANKDANVAELCRLVKLDVDEFVGKAPQFDDITMLALKYKGGASMNTMTVKPVIENMEMVTEFIERTLEDNDMPMKLIISMNIAADELFSNIVKHSGATTAVVSCEVIGGEAVLSFSDDGAPYDPTKQQEPDVTLSAEERDIGGLGIFMVKKSMDSVEYEYVNGMNVITIRKRARQG